jgi:hypothetical protein
MGRKKNVELRAADVCRIVSEHYLAGRHDRCKRWVYRHYVKPVYHISEVTFFRYLAMEEVQGCSGGGKKKGDLPGQLNIFNENDFER